MDIFTVTASLSKSAIKSTKTITLQPEIFTPEAASSVYLLPGISSAINDTYLYAFS